MNRLLAPVFLLLMLGVVRPASAQTFMTVDGPFQFYHSSPEWKQAGGNPIIYQRILEQKMLAAQDKVLKKQYQEMLKQEKAYQKWLADQSAKKAKGKPVDPAYQAMLDEEGRMKAAAEARSARAAAKKAKRSPAARKAAAAKKAAEKDAGQAKAESGDEQAEDDEDETEVKDEAKPPVPTDPKAPGVGATIADPPKA